jgi:hypothetical protein
MAKKNKKGNNAKKAAAQQKPVAVEKVSIRSDCPLRLDLDAQYARGSPPLAARRYSE